MLSTGGDSDRCFATFYFYQGNSTSACWEVKEVLSKERTSESRVHAKPLNKGNKTAFSES